MKTIPRQYLMVLAAGILLLAGAASAREILRPLPVEPIPREMVMKPKVITPESEGRSSKLSHGIIDRVEKKEIVINDSLRSLSPKAEIYSASGKPLSGRSLKAGQRIGYRLGPNNQVIEIRLLENETAR